MTIKTIQPIANPIRVVSSALQLFVDSLKLGTSPRDVMNAAERLSDDHSHLWPRFDGLHVGRLARHAAPYMGKLATAEICTAIKESIEAEVDDPSGIDYPSLNPSPDKRYLITGHQTAGMRCEWDCYIPWANWVDGKIVIAISRPQGNALVATFTYGKKVELVIEASRTITIRPDHVDYLVGCLDAVLGFPYAKRIADSAAYDATGEWGDPNFVTQSCNELVWAALHEAGVSVALVSHVPAYCVRDSQTIEAPAGFLEWLKLNFAPSLNEFIAKVKPEIEAILPKMQAAQAAYNAFRAELSECSRSDRDYSLNSYEANQRRMRELDKACDACRDSEIRVFMVALALPAADQWERTTESWATLENIFAFLTHGVHVPRFTDYDDMDYFEARVAAFHKQFLRHADYWRMVAGIK